MFKAFDEDGNGILDQNEIGRLNATIYNIFPRFGYKGKELPGKFLFDSIINSPYDKLYPILLTYN